jgi:hypothetical protein
MTCLLNGQPVLSLSLHLPMNGAWSAELEVATDKTFGPGLPVTLTLPGEVEYQGLVVRAAQSDTRLQLRLTGGAINWAQPIALQHYRDSDGDKAMRDLGIQTEAPLELDLPFWTRPPGTIGMAVQALATAAQVNWRVNPDGRVRIRDESPFPVTADAIEISRDEARGIVVVAPNVASIMPGTLVGEDQVGDVIYDFGDDFRCRYYVQQRARLRGALERLVRWVTRDALFLGQFTAQVITQAADGTLDLLPEDTRLRATGLQAVPIRHGLPGVKVKVPPGERVLLGFDQGDARKPYAALWHSGAVIEVQIGGVLPVAVAALVDAQLSALKAAIGVAAAAETLGSGLGGTNALNAALSSWPLPAGTSSLILKTS